MEEPQKEKKGFFKKKISIFGKSIPIFALAIFGVVLVSALAVYVLTQTTTITLNDFNEPTISDDITITDMDIGDMEEREIIVTNTNLVPFSCDMELSVLVSGEEVDDISEFVFIESIQTTEVDEYGVDGEDNLVIAGDDTATYNIVYYVPTSYQLDGETEVMDGSEVIQIKAEPTVSQYIGDFYNGENNWINPVTPDWY